MKNIIISQFNIIVKRIAYVFNTKVLLLTVCGMNMIRGSVLNDGVGKGLI